MTPARKAALLRLLNALWLRAPAFATIPFAIAESDPARAAFWFCAGMAYALGVSAGLAAARQGREEQGHED